MFRSATLAAAAAGLALGALSVTPAQSSVSTPPKPVAQRGEVVGCTGADPLVLVWRKRIRSEEGCASTDPLVLVWKRRVSQREFL